MSCSNAMCMQTMEIKLMLSNPNNKRVQRIQDSDCCEFLIQNFFHEGEAGCLFFEDISSTHD